MKEGYHLIVMFLFLALMFVSVFAPVLVFAQEEGIRGNGEEIPFWEREFVGLQVKTWAIIALLIVIIFVVLEGMGWIIAIGGIGYLLWLLLR